MKNSTAILLMFLLLIVVPICFNCAQSGNNKFKWELVLHEPKGFDVVDISSNGDCVVGATRDKVIYLWQKPFSEPPRIRTIPNNSRRVVALEFFGNQDDLFVALADGLVQIWDKGIETKKFEYRFPSEGFVSAISTDGRFIGHAHSYYDRKIEKLVEGEKFAIQSGLSIAGPSRFLISGSGFDDRRLMLSDLENDEVISKEIPYSLTTCALSHDGQYALGLITHHKCEAYLWDISKDHLAAITLNKSLRMFFAGFSPDDSWFIAAGFSGFDVIQTRPLNKLFSSKMEVIAAHIASNTLFAVGDIKGEAQIWSARTGKMVGRHNMNSGPINSIKLYPQTGLLLSGGTKAFTMFRVTGLEQ